MSLTSKIVRRLSHWWKQVAAGVPQADEEGLADGVHDELLDEFIDEIPVGRVLDLGMGEGDNALWLASRGFDVVGVDTSPTAVEAARRAARDAGLALEAHVADIRDFEIEPERYALILATAVLHFLLPDEVCELAERMKAGLQPGGVLIASVFTVDEPGYEMLQEERAPLVAERTFFVSDIDSTLHFFDFGELRSLFHDLEILHYAEERHIDRSRGYSCYHAGAFLVARRGEGIGGLEEPNESEA